MTEDLTDETDVDRCVECGKLFDVPPLATLFCSAACTGTWFNKALPPSWIPAHNECPLCAKHIPDNVGACYDCRKKATRATNRWWLKMQEESQGYPLARAIDAIHANLHDAHLRHWPKEGSGEGFDICLFGPGNGTQRVDSKE